MPNRILKESICTSLSIDSLRPQEETLFYRVIVNCDDFGRMEAAPSILRSKCFPLKIDSIRNQLIAGWLQSLALAGMVKVYQNNGHFYLALLSWDKHQQIRAKRPKYPGPEDEGSEIIEPDSICNQMISIASNCTRNPIQSNPIQYEYDNGN